VGTADASTPFADSGSATQRVLIAQVEKELPFAELDLATEIGRRSVFQCRGRHQVDESERVPVLLSGKVLRGAIEFCVSGGCGSQFFGCRRERGEDFVVAHAAEPVFRVFVVGLATVHDAMPEAATWIMNFLADGVGFVEEVKA